MSSEFLLFLSHYNLLSLHYSNEDIREFLRGIANAGSHGIRVMAMIDCEGLPAPDGGVYGQTWVISPWKYEGSGLKKEYQFDKWDERYFERLEFLLKTASQFNLTVIFCVYVIQKNPLTPLEPDLKLYHLERFLERLRENGFMTKLSHFEILNEGGTGAWGAGGSKEDAETYERCTKLLIYFINQIALKATFYYSGEMPGTLRNYYNIYMPHNFGRDWVEEEARREYLNSLGKLIFPSTDGYKLRLEELKYIFEWCVKEKFMGFEVDVGWFLENDDIRKVDWVSILKIAETYKEVFGHYPQNYGKFPDKPESKPEPELKPRPCKYNWKQFTLKRLWECLIFIICNLLCRGKRDA